MEVQLNIYKTRLELSIPDTLAFLAATMGWLPPSKVSAVEPKG